MEATIRNLGRPAKQSPPSLLPSFLPLLPLPSWKRTVAESTRRGPRILPAESVFFRIRTRRVCSFLFLPSCFLSFFRDRTLVQERINAVLENDDERYVAPSRSAIIHSPGSAVRFNFGSFFKSGLPISKWTIEQERVSVYIYICIYIYREKARDL